MEMKCILLEITSACNHECIYCYNDIKQYIHMSLSRVEQVLKIAASYNINTIMISGGEPLLHPRILDILELFKKYNIRYVLSTNAARITEDVMECFERDNASVQVSFDSIDPWLYSQLRKTEDYGLVIENIKKMIFKNIPVSIGIVLNKQSIVTLGDTIKYFLDLGIRMFHVEEVVIVGQARGAEEDLDIDDFYSVLLELYYLEKDYYPQITIDFIENILLNMLGKIKGRAYCNCMNGTAFQIDILGDVYSCKNHKGLGRGGNIFENEIEEIISNLELPAYYDKIENCERCSYGEICKGLCRAKSFAWYNSLNMPARRCNEMKSFLDFLMKEKEAGKIDKLLMSIEWSNYFSGEKYTKWI